MVFDIDQITRQFAIVRHYESKGRFHYLDNAATAQIPDCVISAMTEHDTRRRSNVRRGIHTLAQEANDAFETARDRVATYLGIQNSDEVIFTGGTTAGINMMALGFGQNLESGDEIVLSQAEHHSNLVPWQMLKQLKGVTLRFLPVDGNGVLDLSRAEEIITPATKLVAVTHASNVTGAITDVAAIGKIARERGAKLLLDGAQMAPHGPLNLPGLGADFYVFSGHKTYGPGGVGILWGRMESLEEMPPAFGGGEMVGHVTFEKTSYAAPPRKFEAGTPPITQAVGLGAALEWLGNHDPQGIRNHLNSLTEQIMAGMAQLNSRHDSRIRILGPSRGERRLPLISFSIGGAHPHDICQIMNDRHGVALRGGHHCAEPLHAIFDLDGTTRASLGMFNRQEDVDALLNGIEDCLNILT
ncbi:MAG: cysteine desulfurase [Deltaproteobacteria bacterium]|jgi:cysteine desulfurase / selenocysteine lyase|nr:cysteine desulfurase [Deltaproteobacteria bacterium]